MTKVAVQMAKGSLDKNEILEAMLKQDEEDFLDRGDVTSLPTLQAVFFV